MAEAREGFNRLSTLIVGANTIAQAAIPAVLTPQPGSVEEASLERATAHYLGTLQANATFTYGRLCQIPGLRPVEPQGVCVRPLAPPPPFVASGIRPTRCRFPPNFRPPLQRLPRRPIPPPVRTPALPPPNSRRAAGAMYVMVGFDPSALEGVADGSDLCMQLLNEEGVFVLPGGCFGASDFFRVVFSGPQEKLAEAFDRIESFCRRKAKA